MLNKKNIAYVLIPTLLIQTTAFGQNTQQRPGIGGGIVTQVTAGTYRAEIYDEGKLKSEIFSRYSKLADVQADYIKSINLQLNQAMQQLVQDTLLSSKGLQDITNKSLAASIKFTSGDDALNPANVGIGMGDYLQAVANYEAGVLSLNTLMGGLAEIPGAVSSQKDFTAGQLSVTLSGPVSNIDLSPLVRHYNKQLASLDAKVRGMQLRMVGTDGNPVIITAPDRPKLAVKPEEIESMERAKVKLEAHVVTLRQPLIDFAGFVYTNISTWAQAYGNKQKFQFMNEPMRAQMQGDLQQIDYAMWFRSFMRSLPGIQMGVLEVDYTQQKFGLDFFTSTTDLLSTLRPVVPAPSNTLSAAHVALLNALRTAEARSVNPLQKDPNYSAKMSDVVDAMKGVRNDPGFAHLSSTIADYLPLSRIMSSITILKGDMQLGMVNATLLNYILTDMDEELTLASPGGKQAVLQKYKARYKNTPERAAVFKDLECQYWIGKKCDGSLATDAMGVDPNTLKGQIKVLVAATKGVVAFVDKARELQEQIDLLQSTNQNLQQINNDILNQ